MPQKYLNDPELDFPVKHSRLPLKIISATGYCKVCGRPTRDLRGTVTEYPGCLEIRFGGACHPCRTITYAQFRYYAWGMLQKTDNGWVAVEKESSLWEELSGFCRRSWKTVRKHWRGN